MRFSFLLLVFITLITYQAGAQKHVNFKRLSRNDGLSQSTVQSIIKDRYGFMWMGTREGLNKYDGYKFSIYKHDPEKDESISNNYINDIYEDREGSLWIGTRSGLNKFDRENNSFIHFNKGDTTFFINKIFQDSKENIWLATKQGLFLFNPASGTYKGYRHSDTNPNSVSKTNVSRIIEDSNGELWLGTEQGLDRFNPLTEKFIHYKNDSSDSKSISSNTIKDLCKDNNGNIWIGTQGGGVSMYNRKDDSFINYTHDSKDKKTISANNILSVTVGFNNNIWIGTEDEGLNEFNLKTKEFTVYKFEASDNTARCIYKDDLGNMWVGTHSGGVIFLSKYGEKFKCYRNDLFDEKSLSNSIIKSICEDSDGDIWIGTEGGGVNLFDRKKEVFSHYYKDINNKNSISNNNNLCIIEVNSDTIALGYNRSGFDFYNRKTGKFTHYELKESSINGSFEATVPAMMKDHNGDIWIGTSAGGINVYNRKTKQFIRYKHSDQDKKSISSNGVQAFFEDKDGNVWVGTNNGLNLFLRKQDYFISYVHDDKDKKSISNSSVYCIMQDHKDNIWIGTEGGLNLFDKQNQTFLAYTENYGLPDNVIYGILEDKKGNLWLSTNKGIARFNPETETFRSYGVSDGVQSNEFKKGAYMKNAKGELFFGGINGLNVFIPDSIRDNTFIPPIVIRDFQIFNRSVINDKNNPFLPKHISVTKEITLSYKESVFSFDFAALNFTSPEKNQYAYKMEGFDKDWNYVGDQRKATYTNLDAGEYVFKVKGSNNDGLWNEEGTSIKVIITPPYWSTWWFRALVIIAILGLIFTWYKTRMNRMGKQKEILELQVKERTLQLEQANEDLLGKKEEMEVQAENLRNQGEKLEILYSEIKSSINAAQVIQESILPSEALIREYLPEFFILYKPQAVVSGDFYWFNIKEDKIIFAAVDCTGHGVSGAFMSINAHHILNQAIFPYSKMVASEVLDRLNEGIINELHQKDHNMIAGAGMDIALCIIDKDKSSLQFSGANNPLYIVRDKKLIQIKGNKFPIGYLKGNINKFTNHEIGLQKGDIVYLFSDGYADQIGGGALDEKIMYPRFRELLLSISDKCMEEQHLALDKYLNDWKGGGEQLDDILVMGFKV